MILNYFNKFFVVFCLISILGGCSQQQTINPKPDYSTPYQKDVNGQITGVRRDIGSLQERVDKQMEELRNSG